MKTMNKTKTLRQTNGTQTGAKSDASKRQPEQFEIDRSPAARAAMKAFRMTHERLHGAKVKRA